MYAILHLYGWYVAGFAGPALARGPLGTGTRLDRPAVVLMLCAAGCGGFLYWELAERTRLLLPEWNTIPEEVTVVREETPYRDYFPFSTLEPQEKIARLDAPASLRIRDGYPRLDGATAFMPLSSATLMAVYEIPSSLLTLDGATDPDAERYMFISQFFSSNTSRKAYSNLINGKADLIVVFGPSEEQQAEADTAGVPLKLTPIGKEAFVFFVNEKNPVDGLSLEEVRKIYSGGIGNWREVGGPDAPILAYQRPKDSGSRTAMDQMVMQGLSQARPLREEYFAPMEGIVTAVADYRNESPAIGYSFRWFLTTMYSEPGLKLLTINGVAPTVEHIADGTYPLTRTFYAVTRKKDALPETEALAAWLAGPEGQALVGKAGYVPIR